MDIRPYCINLNHIKCSETLPSTTAIGFVLFNVRFVKHWMHGLKFGGRHFLFATIMSASSFCHLGLSDSL